MGIHIYLGWWALPAAITVLAFVIASIWGYVEESNSPSSFGGGCCLFLAWFVALLISGASWAIYAAFAISLGKGWI